MSSDQAKKAALNVLQRLGVPPLALGCVKTFDGCVGSPALLRALTPGSRIVIRIRRAPKVWIVRTGNEGIAVAVVMSAGRSNSHKNVYLTARMPLRDLIKLLAEKSVCQEGDPMPRYPWAKIAERLKCMRQEVFQNEAEALKSIGWVELKK